MINKDVRHVTVFGQDLPGLKFLFTLLSQQNPRISTVLVVNYVLPPGRDRITRFVNEYGFLPNPYRLTEGESLEETIDRMLNDHSCPIYSVLNYGKFFLGDRPYQVVIQTGDRHYRLVQSYTPGAGNLS